jgi:hypothetical protein
MSGRASTPSRRGIRSVESPPLVDHPIEILQPWVEKAKNETVLFEDFLHDTHLLSSTEEEEVRIPLLFVLSRCSFDASHATPVRTLVVPMIHESLNSDDGHGNLYGVTILQRLWENGTPTFFLLQYYINTLHLFAHLFLTWCAFHPPLSMDDCRCVERVVGLGVDGV